ncbi:CYTH domain-containing protein [Desulforhopalus singaporensis]|uniref:CYTH domain-containing protein n=1 Tax=Desulforhopalus singaporensis TaxID=91360 RepID=A0A1H0S707_9BACT|nr:CYTH domain-containing protein [Desulforhopalus singaporensis]SDP37006.1 CYTH domain-containing protein [Desulforhopalus singaporensis]
MPQEIEKKFLTKNDDWRQLGSGKSYRQGYLSGERGNTVRVRIAGDEGFLTIKGAGDGESRLEFEYRIPLEEAREMLMKLCRKPLIEKTRYKVFHGGFTWEIDEFKGENAGLIFAEIELQYPGQKFDLPDWIGDEVTGDPRYYNASLVSRPYSSWK